MFDREYIPRPKALRPWRPLKQHLILQLSHTEGEHTEKRLLKETLDRRREYVDGTWMMKGFRSCGSLSLAEMLINLKKSSQMT